MSSLSLLTKQARKEINCAILLYVAFPLFLKRFLGVSIRHGAFIRGERLIQSLHVRGAFIGYKVFI